MNVAFQGEIGAYSEEAVLALFPNATVVPLVSFETVFEQVEGGEVDYGVVPIENSLFGSVHVNYDLLRRHSLRIVGEWYLRIQHHLLACRSLPLDRVEAVYSHPQALGQCQDFLKTRLAHAEIVPAYDTAGAAKMVAGDPDHRYAAIASKRAALEYGLSYWRAASRAITRITPGSWPCNVWTRRGSRFRAEMR
jgi:prephenate dehydratase